MEQERHELEVVEVTKPNGEQLPEDEIPEWLRKLQAGVHYIPQNR